MALRVLLADESSTIKKVMQLALQDYGIDVKSVPNGLDVITVAKAFKPEIIFADVLLTKRSGYDICADLNKDPETQNIPVVLMWSGFMELDQERFRNSHAMGKLEKPFDADSLRNLINTLVPRTTTNPVSAFLKFPKLPEFIDERKKQAQETLEPRVSEIHEISDKSIIINDGNESFELKVDTFDADENFTQVPLHQTKENLSPLSNPKNSEDAWSQQNLSKFKLQLDPDTENPENNFNIADASLDKISLKSDGEFEEVHFGSLQEEDDEDDNEAEERDEKTNLSPYQPAAPASFDNRVSEQRLILEARSVIESICWKILPDIAEKIVREEIQKLLKDIEKQA